MLHLIKMIWDVICAPYRWIRATIRRDRFVVYPGQCDIFIGLPGSGKTLSAVAMARRSRKMYRKICATPDAGMVGALTIYDDTWGQYKISNSLIIIDESALNGFFSRDALANFSSRGGKRNKLTALKLRRHLHNGLIITTQSFGDNDNVIRSMTNHVWVCRKLLPGYVIAERAIVWYTFDEQGNYTQRIDTPTLFDKLVNPYQSKITSIRKYKKYYNSYVVPDEYKSLPEIH